LDIYFIYRFRYNIEVDEEKVDTYNILVGGLLVVLSARCGLEAWMQMELYLCDRIRGLSQ
jgi:hypothetical protein